MRKVEDLIIGIYIVIGITANGDFQQSEVFNTLKPAKTYVKNKNKNKISTLTYFIYNVINAKLILE